MIFLLVFFGMISIVSTTCLYFSVKKNLEFMESQERLMEQLEESIEILEVCHKKFDKKLKLELFSDEPTVKELVEDIKQARKAVLLISENLTGEKEIMELDDAMVSKDSL